MGRRAIDIIGETFNYIFVKERIGSNKWKEPTFLCVCTRCGSEFVAKSSAIRYGKVKSCGCEYKQQVSDRMKEYFLAYQHPNYKHGDSHTRLFGIWSSMKERCLNQNNKRFHQYGGRGIVVCDEWVNDYGAFKDWAIQNGYQDSLTLDRIDVNGNYAPDNCRWVSWEVQQNNRRNNRILSFNGKTQTMAEWSKELGIKEKTLSQRLNTYHWSVERALTEPVHPPFGYRERN